VLENGRRCRSAIVLPHLLHLYEIVGSNIGNGLAEAFGDTDKVDTRLYHRENLAAVSCRSCTSTRYSRTMARPAKKSSSANEWRNSSRIKSLISREIRAKARPRAVAINTMPLWSVGVTTVSGGDCPGYRPVSLEAMAGGLEEH
jgi:hypothetical protein